MSEQENTWRFHPKVAIQLMAWMHQGKDPSLFDWILDEAERIYRWIDRDCEGTASLDDDEGRANTRWIAQFFFADHVLSEPTRMETLSLNETLERTLWARKSAGESKKRSRTAVSLSSQAPLPAPNALAALEALEQHRSQIRIVYELASPAQRQISFLIRDGLQDAEIADRLGCSESTIRVQRPPDQKNLPPDVNKTSFEGCPCVRANSKGVSHETLPLHFAGRMPGNCHPADRQ